MGRVHSPNLKPNHGGDKALSFTGHYLGLEPATCPKKKNLLLAPKRALPKQIAFTYDHNGIGTAAGWVMVSLDFLPLSPLVKVMSLWNN